VPIETPETHIISPGSEDHFMATMSSEATDYRTYVEAPESSAEATHNRASSNDWQDIHKFSPRDTEERVTEVPSIEQLKVRGKGHYTCPHGTACDKGGVQPDGELTVYERNSAFRYVPNTI
jgi:hypothetical protein